MRNVLHTAHKKLCLVEAYIQDCDACMRRKAKECKTQRLLRPMYECVSICFNAVLKRKDKPACPCNNQCENGSIALQMGNRPRSKSHGDNRTDP